MSGQVEFTSPKAAIALSRREIEVLTLAARGETYDNISALLSITKDTAKAHMENARHKIGAINKAHAVALAVSQGHIKL